MKKLVLLGLVSSFIFAGTVSLKDCSDGCCSVYSDGNYVGSMCVHANKYSGGIEYYISSSNSSSACQDFVSGDYFPNTGTLRIVDGDNVSANSLGDAVYKMAKYWVNCSVY